MHSLGARRITILLAGIFLSTGIFAQYAQSSFYWKLERQRLNFGIGASNFLGELGGRDQIGSDFIWDLEPSQSRPALHIDYLYYLKRTVALRAGLTYGMAAGNDNLTEETFRKNRNIHFRSHLLELSLMAQIDLITFYPSGAAGTPASQRVRPSGSVLYGFAGIGGLYFNPQAKYRGDWVDLRPLGTEGQNQPNGPSKYSRITPVIPVGLGYRYIINREWSVGIEVSYRKTFTDYIDDTSTDYYDNGAIEQSQGELAAYFADPSLGYRVNDAGQQVPLNSTFEGAQRGDPDDQDAYIFAFINAHYKLIRSRFKRKRGRLFRRRTKRALF